MYYATEVAFEEGAEESGRLKKRLEELIGDALVVADQSKFDVFNALTLMDNNSILQDLKVCYVSFSDRTCIIMLTDVSHSLEEAMVCFTSISTTGGHQCCLE